MNDAVTNITKAHNKEKLCTQYEFNWTCVELSAEWSVLIPISYSFKNIGTFKNMTRSIKVQNSL